MAFSLPACELKRPGDLPRLAFCLERVTKPEGKKHIIRQARTAVVHYPPRIESEDTICDKLANYIRDDDYTIDQSEHPILAASLTWAHILDQIRDHEDDSPEPGEQTYLLIIDLEAVSNRRVYDGRQLAVSATDAGFAKYTVDGAAPGERALHEVDDLALVYPGNLDSGLGLVAILEAGEGEISEVAWKGKTIKLPTAYGQEVELRVRLQSTTLTDELDTGVLIEDDLNAQFRQLQPESSQGWRSFLVHDIMNAMCD
jgi:hypothetical protein